MKNTRNWVLITFSLMIISKLVDHLTGFNLHHTYSNVWVHWIMMLVIMLYTGIGYIYPIVAKVNKEIEDETLG